MRTCFHKPRLLRLNSQGTQNMILRTALVLHLTSAFPWETRNLLSTCGVRCPKVWGLRRGQEITTTRAYCCWAVSPSWRHDRGFVTRYDRTIWMKSTGIMTTQREFEVRRTPMSRVFSIREPKWQATCETHVWHMWMIHTCSHSWGDRIACFPKGLLPVSANVRNPSSANPRNLADVANFGSDNPIFCSGTNSK